MKALQRFMLKTFTTLMIANLVLSSPLISFGPLKPLGPANSSYAMGTAATFQHAPKPPLYKYFNPKEDYRKVITDYVLKTAKRELAAPVHLEGALFNVSASGVEITLDTYSKDFKTIESVPYVIPAKAFKYPLNLKAQALLTGADIKTGTTKLFKPYYESRVTYPILSGLRLKSFQDQINKDILTDINTFNDALLNQAAGDYAELEPQGLFTNPYTLDVSYIVQKNTSQIVSLQVIYWYETGGAHGLWETRSYTYDLRTNKKMALKDFFKGSYSYEKVLTEKVKGQLNAIAAQYKKNHLACGGTASDYASPIMDFKGVNQATQFYVKDDQLILYYNLYEILPYAFGTPNFPVPLRDLQSGISWQIN